MMTITDLARSFGSQVLFEQVSLQLDPGNRYGLVGANGSGKSTLLRILSDLESSSAGTVATPRNARLGVLAQDHFAWEHVPIADVVMMGDDEVWGALREQEAMLAAESFDEGRFAALEEVIARCNGYTLSSRASAILEGLGIPTKLHRQPLSTLSGGFKLRALLGQVLAGRPDILLLDEPTNHLDIVSVAWLERFLLDYSGTAVVVSHDQQFLDNVCTHILDLDYERVTAYKGNYTAFSAAKVAYRQRKELEIARRKAEIAEREAWIARFKATATKARQAASRQKQVERIVVEELPQSSRRYPSFKLSQLRPSGREVLTVKDLWKAYGDKVVLSEVSFTVHRGEKIAVLGPNGAGKSTLLRALVGALKPDAGTITWGHEARPGYFPQDHREILETGEQNLLAWLWDVCPAEGVGFVRGKLAEVLFGADDVGKRVAVVSGGEAARLILARLGLEKPNVLVLDEPTNHLDLEAIEALEQAIQRYDGTLLLVSHNRWLVSRVATRILEVSPAGVRDFPGTYAEYLRREGADHLDREAVVVAAREERRAAKALPSPAAVPLPKAAPAKPEATPKKASTKADKKPPPPKGKAGKQPLWFEDQAEDKPESGSWAEFFARLPSRGQPTRR